jgi:hypothetical protein
MRSSTDGVTSLEFVNGTDRREAVLCGAAAAAMIAFLVVMASWSVPQLDDWYEVLWIDHHGFSLSSVLDFAHYNYANYNPRLGETLLLVVDGSRLIHCIITPAFQIALVVFAFVLAHEAWPRATFRDLGRLVVLQALLWLVIPIPGVLYFYRPYTANYVFATCLQLGLFAMFRLELARPDTTRRAWLVPPMFVLGVAAGFGNEHTGPTAIVVAIAAVVWARRQRRLREWMVGGAIGLVLGYAFLVLAPGQSVRYAAMAGGEHPFRAMLSRGIDGNFKFVGDFLVEVAPGLALVIAAALVAFARRGAARVELSRSLAIRIALALAAALAIVITTFASPIVEDRLFFAPCVVTAIALAVACEAIAEPRARALVIAVASLVVVVHVVGFAVTYRDVAARTDLRTAALRAAGSHDVVTVAPAEMWRRDHWRYGEDLQFAYMRELLAHRVFDVDALELDGAPAWLQPTPPEQVDVRVQLDPPSPVVAPLGLRPPTQWPWAVRELRESWSTFAPTGTVRAIDVAITPATPLPGDRPVHLVTWHPDGFAYLDAHTRSDAQGLPYAWFDTRRMPLVATEAWIDACGSVVRSELTTGDHELRVAMRYRCGGNHTIYLCDASECWLGWRYW